MKKLICASLLLIAACSAQADRPAITSGQTQSGQTTAQVDRRPSLKPSYHTINAYVCEVDEDEWYGVCASFEKHTFYGFEIFDEINAGDRVRAVVCDNATPFIYHDDYIVQVYYGW